MNSDLTMKINPGAPVFVFTFQAQNDDEGNVPQLTLAQIEAARNAAVSVLELLGASVESTSAVLEIPATETASKLVLTPTVKTLAELAQETADAQAQADAEAAALEAARAQARAETEALAAEAEEEAETSESNEAEPNEE